MQYVTSSRAAEDSVLVLEADHVDVVEVQEFRGIAIGLQVVLGKRPTYACGIVVALFGIVDRECQQSSCAVLRGDRAAKVGRKGGDSTLPRKIIPNHGDSTGQRWFGLQARASG